MKFEVGDKVQEKGFPSKVYTVVREMEKNEYELRDYNGKLEVMACDALHKFNKQELDIAYKSANDLK